MIKIGCPSFGTDCGRSGIGSYFRELLDRFDQAPYSQDYSFELIGPEKDKEYYLEGKKNISWYQVENVDGSPMQNFFWNQFKLPKICKERHYDLLFLPAANRRICGWAPCPIIGTVHDLATLHLKNKYDFSHAVFNRNMLPFLIRRLDSIITVSQFSKDDIVKFAKVPEKRVTVIPLAADSKRFYPKKDRKVIKDRIAKKFSITEPYILYISRLEHPGKNHVNLIKAFDLFRQETTIPYQLVLPGPDKERSEEIHTVAKASPFSHDIKFLGFIDNDDVADLYRGAELFVLPSFFEGFGLPVLEAMACGTPVITSDAASLPEVSGPHTPHFPPDSCEQMKAAMKKVLGSKETRNLLSEQSLAWANLYSWDKTVAQTLSVFDNALKQGKKR
ncbi:glycosyltransferase family 1 protein [uncultured Sphaerochaeta sp.]|uniref:glycosyltransferase family 4 protein n=1 Tax=uncultured Sphaerochaeta sp. TaxID=886478 RepID=UPI002A0A7336|nr:glycosyltransferase family 1 protein [uncultured Sphaerochaeta sp.]